MEFSFPLIIIQIQIWNRKIYTNNTNVAGTKKFPRTKDQMNLQSDKIH